MNGQVSLSSPDNTYQQANYKYLQAGDYAIVATVNLSTDTPFGGDEITDLSCYLSNGHNSIGDATARVFVQEDQNSGVSLSMNAGVQFDAGGGAVTVLCKGQDGGEVIDSQVMFLRTAGYF